MSRYYFDLFDDDGLTRDDEGQEFASRDRVRDEAVKSLPGIAGDEMPNGDEQTFAVKVRDETGRYIFEATLCVAARWID